MSEEPNKCGKLLTRDYACGRPDAHKGPCGDPWKPDGKRRANYLPAPHFYNLNAACTIVNAALDGFGCYLVGSSVERRDYRDVDVRYIMSDEAFDRMFRHGGNAYDALWSLMCTTIALWLRQQTDLPIDFQIQRQTDANAKHGGERHALGIFHSYPGELPSTAKT